MKVFLKKRVCFGVFFFLMVTSLGWGQAFSSLIVEAVNSYQQGNATEAIQVATRAVESAKKEYGSEHANVANALLVLGNFNRKSGKLSEAQKAYSKAITIREKNLGLESIELILPLTYLGEVLQKQGKLKQAETQMRRAYEVSEKNFGASQMNVCAPIEYLADVLKAQGKNAEAEKYLKRSLEIKQRCIVERTPKIEALKSEIERSARPLESKAACPSPIKLPMTLPELRENSVLSKVESLQNPEKGEAVVKTDNLKDSRENLASSSEKCEGNNASGSIIQNDKRANEIQKKPKEKVAANLNAQKQTAAENAPKQIVSEKDEVEKTEQRENGPAKVLSDAVRSINPSKIEKVFKRTISGFSVSSKKAKANTQSESKDASEEERLKEALEVAERTQGENNLVVAFRLKNLSDFYTKYGEYENAEKALQRAEKISVEIPAEKGESPLPGIYESLGNVKELTNSLKEAEGYYKKALDLLLKQADSDDLEIAASCDNLGELYQQMERYSASEEYFKKSLALRTKKLGNSHKILMISYDNLGCLYRNMGEFEKAEQYYKIDIELTKSIVGSESIDVAVGLSNLAGLYQDWKKLAESEEMYNKALEIKKKVFGETHPEVAKTLNNLGALYQDKGDYVHAEKCYKTALSIKESVLGPKSCELKVVLNNLASVLQQQGRNAEAWQYFQRLKELKD
ncbi:MAG: tetratricopeptide repeat protein [Candidatus Riflebacteria bacterium]|nr:tetratricopeptide repeat protein [Candidatus Riflebacteria bacterium]